MSSLIFCRRIAVTLAFLAVIVVSGCNNKKADESANSNAQNSPSTSATTASPTETTAASPSPSTASAASTQGVAPQGTSCPSGNPVKGVNSKRLGKIALTSNSPEYSKTKADKCFPDAATAQQAGYKSSAK